MIEFSFSVLISIVASLIVAYLTAKVTIGNRYGEGCQRLFVAIMKYYFSFEALVNEEKLQKVDDGLRFKKPRDEDIYLNQLEAVYTSVSSILDSPASAELLNKNLQIAALPIAITVEIYNFKTSKLLSNKSCLRTMFDVMDFLLQQKPIQNLQGQKIHNEIIEIQNKLNDTYLIELLGFNPNEGI